MPNTQSLLQNVYLFKELTPSELEKINAISRPESFSPGEEIFSEGDAAHSLYVIKFGTVKVQHSTKDERIDVTTLGTGSHFGEMAFLDGEKRSASVVAVEKTELVAISFEELRKVLEENSAIAVKVYKAMAQFLCGRLRVTTTDLSFAREKNLRHHF